MVIRDILQVFISMVILLCSNHFTDSHRGLLMLAAERTIDDKNIDFRIKKHKKHVFFTFIKKNIKKTCIKNIKTTGVIKWV